MKLHFTKMEGTGNDFIVVDDSDSRYVGREEDLATRLCPRSTAIGADGIIFVRNPPDGSNCVVEMAYYNADGSYSGMCGNGLRCTALFAVKCLGVTGEEMHVYADGETHLAMIKASGERTAVVGVGMGEPVFEVERVPAGVEGPRHIGKPLQLAEDFIAECTLLSIGNPHCVMWVDELSDDLLERIGPQVETSPLFPERVNAGFALKRGDQIELRVWERGCGETMACGSGACAAAISAMLTGRAEKGRNTAVRMLGGMLYVRWDGEGTPVVLTGPASIVYEGTVEV